MINTMEIDLKVGSLLVGFSILQFTFACRRGNAIEGGQVWGAIDYNIRLTKCFMYRGIIVSIGVVTADLYQNNLSQ